MSYIPLHIHSEYSLLDGAIQFPSLVKYLQELGITSCAITDHGWMGGVVEFYKKCKKAKIKPLLGIEAYVTQDEDDLPEEIQKTRDNNHIVLIAKDNIGLKILYKLISEAVTHNFYYKPRIYRPKLEQLSGHCIVTTACLKGDLASRCHFQENNYGGITKVSSNPGFNSLLKWYRERFEKDFYLEFQDWDDETHKQREYNSFITQTAAYTGLPLVITSDAHYLKKEDHELHKMLMAMQFKMTLDKYKESDMMQYGPHFYIKTPEEMVQSCTRWNCPEACKNTLEIAEKCNTEIEIGKYEYPEFDITEMEDYEEFLSYRSKQ